MSIQTALLACMRTREGFNELHGALDLDTIDPKQRVMVAAFERYFERHPSHAEIQWDVFSPWFFDVGRPNMKEEEAAMFRLIIGASARQVDADIRSSIKEDLYQLSTSTRIAHLIAAFDAGEEPFVIEKISQEMDRYNAVVRTGRDPYVPMDIEDIMQEEANDEGVRWRLQCINMSMRPLRPGDFGLIAARPDQGKTSFLTDQLTFMATQIEEGDDILWLNNEGPSRKINARLLQSAIGQSGFAMAQRPAADIRKQYVDAVGRFDRIKVMGITGFNTFQVERLIAHSKAKIVVFDMIDNIRGFGDAARTDLMLERMYQWCRELAEKHNTINLATSQVSNEGATLLYPTMGMLKDSKTGKQGAVDFQLMIGSHEGTMPGSDNVRAVSLPKNKLRRASSPPLRQDVIFDRDAGRFTEITHVDQAEAFDPAQHGKV